MTPTLVHRYAFPIREAIEALLGDAVGDCEAWRIRIEGEEVVVDVIAPAPGIVPTVANVTSLTMEPPAETMEPASKIEPELKGGPLARRAAIACGERGFWTFLGVTSAEEAKADICQRCRIDSRKMLDHDERAAAAWAKIDDTYRLWLEGYDVELA